jgi:hypothetical protein
MTMNACGMLGAYPMVVGHLENGEMDGDNIKMDCWEIGCEDWKRVELAQDNLTIESSRLCIIGFNIKNFTFCSSSAFMCFVWITKQTAVISICNITGFKIHCAYCLLLGMN